MKTKSIDSSLFEEIKKVSFQNVKNELLEATKNFSESLNINFGLYDFNESYVLFSSPNPTAFLKANYALTDKDTIRLENFETLLIDSNSILEERKNILRNITESLIEDNGKIDEHWNQLMSRLLYTEMVKKRASKGHVGIGDPAKADNADEENQGAQGRARANKKGTVSGDEEMNSKELKTLDALDSSLEESVNSLPNYKEIRNQLIEAAKEVSAIMFNENKGCKITTKKNEEGEPELATAEIDTTIKKAKKGKEKDGAKGMRNKIAAKRKELAKIVKSAGFAETMKNIKTFNNLGEEKELAETLTNFVTSNPSLIYVSKNELSNAIFDVLENEENADQLLCDEIAEGLRKLAYNTFQDKAYEVIRLAAIEDVVGLDEEVSDDNYEAFEEVSSRYFEDIYEKDSKIQKSLSNLAEMIARTAVVLESDLRASGNTNLKPVAQLRQFASQVNESARTTINESVMKMVVGSLLSGVSGDYSLNKTTLVPYGHFRPAIDMDGNDYGKHVGNGKKSACCGDEEMMSPNNGNPMAPKYKKDVDLESDYKFWSRKGTKTSMKGDEEMEGSGNPMAPKYKKAAELDLL